MRLLIGLSLLLATALSSPAQAAEPARVATLYKDPQCGCCTAYADHLHAEGFSVTVIATDDLPRVKQKNGVPGQLESCHTMVVGGYVVEGHVPMAILDRLLSERPDIEGISLPGMPAGSPGMGGAKTAPFTVYELSDEAKVYAVE